MSIKKETVYGVSLITALALAAWFIAKIPFVKALSFSSLIIGILLGMVYANVPLRARTPKSWEPGFKFCSKTMLRTGIVLYGFRLTFQDIVAVGLPAIVIDVIVVTATIFLGIWIGKLLKMDKETTLLTATGSAICGAAAVLGAEAVVKPESHKTAVAVSTVVIFGTLAMFLYPIAYRAGWMVGLNPQEVGIYTGATLHEVAHVVGAGNAMAVEEIASTALIVKMVRVILLVFVLLVMSWVIARKKDGAKGEKTKITIPWFAFLFLLMIGVNSAIHAWCPAEALAKNGWMGITLHVVEIVSTFMLTMAMTALGADTSFAKFKQAGAKPFALAAILWVWLIVGGYLMARFLVPIF